METIISVKDLVNRFGNQVAWISVVMKLWV